MLFDNGMKRTTVFRRESLEIKLSLLISSCPTTSSMALRHTLVVLVLLGQTELRPLCVCSRSIMAKALADEGFAEKVTVRQAVKKVAWARNCQLTVSGYSPLEIATGRRPPDLFDVETCSPEQLSVEPSSEDRTTLELQRIALRAHQEARQAIDLLKDLARRVMPSDGPYRKGDRVLFGTRMSRRRSLKAFGSEVLLCHRKVPWFWSRFIALCFE